LRADLLPQQDAPTLRLKLKEYLEQRIHFYCSRDERELQATSVYTAKLQSENVD
jgi:hypothetical protein